MKNRVSACFVSILLIVTFGVLAGCEYTADYVPSSPSPSLLPISDSNRMLSPDASNYLQVSPGPDADRFFFPEPFDTYESSETKNSQSSQLEEAKTIFTAAKSIAEVQDAAVVVTDDKKCFVALQLRVGTTIDHEIQNKIIAAKAKETQIRITSDRKIYEKIKVLEYQKQIGKSVSFDELEAYWDKMQIASN